VTVYCACIHTSGNKVSPIIDTIQSSDLVHRLHTEVFERRKASYLHHAITTMFKGKPHIALVLGCESKNVRNRTIGYKFLEF
jgi:hypothetical protein